MKKKIALRYTIFLSVTRKLLPILLMVLVFSARTYSQGNNYHHFKGDSIHVRPDSLPPMHHDSVPPPPPPPHDSLPPFPHDTIRFDTVPPPPPPPPPHPGHHDSLPPFPRDTIHFDTIAPPPPPRPRPHDSLPPMPRDTIHFDSIVPPIPFPHDSFPPPPPPPPHDSTGKGGHREEVGADNTTTMTVSVYPNPMADNATVYIETAANANVSFVMFDITGKLVVSMNNLSNGDYSLNRSELGSGMYFYKVYDTNNNTITGKIIIQ